MYLVVGSADLSQALPDSILAVEKQVLRHLDTLVHACFRVSQQQLDDLLIL